MVPPKCPKEVMKLEDRITKMESFFAEKIAGCQAQGSALLSDGRGDEANFEKVRGNIYDIFRTVLSAGVKHCQGEPEATGHFFAQRLEQIPESWASALTRAEAHGDDARSHLERVKLDTVADIRAAFAAIWEGAK